MARPELPLGAYGKITTTESSAGFTSITKFRDMDGVVRRVKRNGKTAAAAERTLKAALINRQAPVKDAAVEPGSKFSKVAELWFTEFEQLVGSGQRSSGSPDTYRSI
jgi:lysozyme family protein